MRSKVNLRAPLTNIIWWLKSILLNLFINEEVSSKNKLPIGKSDLYFCIHAPMPIKRLTFRCFINDAILVYN